MAVITGAARGLGQGIALTFAREGANIVVCDIGGLEETTRQVAALGGKIIAVKTNVTKKSEVGGLMETAVKNFGRLDILVNNAGFRRQSSLLEMTEDDWDAVLAVNLKGVLFCIQCAAKYMIQQKYGKIISLASTAGLSTVKSIAGVNYQCSKAGVIKLTRAAAEELGPSGVNVNAIAPGLVPTEGAFTQRTPEQIRKMVEVVKQEASLRRTGEIQEVANLALFLASDDSSYITGQVIAVDGGWK